MVVDEYRWNAEMHWELDVRYRDLDLLTDPSTPKYQLGLLTIYSDPFIEVSRNN